MPTRQVSKRVKRNAYKRPQNGYYSAIISLALFALVLLPNAASAQSRIKDIVNFEGVRDNQLVGYGLVVGLNGTGDGLDSAIFTRESLVGMLQRLGVNADDASLNTDNVAAVAVTATLPPFSRVGTTIDVNVSALGNATSLLGGTLLVTPLVGADGEVYSVAQGTLAVGGFSAQGAAETVVKGVPTSARIANGGIVEREIPFELADLRRMRISLRNPDFTTARRVSRAINAFVGIDTTKVLDPSTIEMTIPDNFTGRVVELITDIEQLRVEPDQIARVIIDEQSGIIVMGENVRVNRVAIAQGSLTIRVTEAEQVSQPQPFSNTGTTETVDRTDVTVDESGDRRLGILDPGVTLQELVNGLNALGVGPRDMITILQAIKFSGAMQADIKVL